MVSEKDLDVDKNGDNKKIDAREGAREDARDVDQISGVETTGHEWDGIKELDNPLPRWWLWVFYLTIVFSVGYLFWYPAIPLVETSTMGISGETLRGNLSEEMSDIRKVFEENDKRLLSLDLEEIRQDETLFRYALVGGSSLYKINCSQCHGSGAQGARGIPNLNDDDWLWGGDLKAIYDTINHGIRAPFSDEARFSEMPAFGDDYLENSAISNVAAYVRSLSNLDTNFTREQLDAGRLVYEENCTSCHGDNGEGDREVGAPNLADAIWLNGFRHADIASQIRRPKHGVMPGWGEKLGEANVKKISIYVHNLGGGEEAPK